jgi:hypothetical protein
VDTLVRSELGAAEIAGSAGNPAYGLDRNHLSYVTLGPYLSAVRAIGSPAYSEHQLLATAPSYQERADATLIGAEGIQARQFSGPVSGFCTSLAGDPSAGALVVKLATGSSAYIEVRGTPLALWLRRFTPVFPDAPQQQLAPDSTSTVHVPRDGSSLPWWLQIGARPGPVPTGTGELAKVCVTPGP